MFLHSHIPADASDILAAIDYKVSLIAQLIKILPAIQDTWVQFLGWEDPLEKEMATHSSIPTWRIAWTKSLAGYSPWDGKSQTWLSN